MKTRRQQQASEDAQTICRRNTRPKTSLDGVENSLPIPIDLIDEIFSRLPARSIATCRCVSKLWASILGRQDFTELFLTRSSARPQLLFTYQRQGEFTFLSSPQPQNPDEMSSPVVANYHMKFPIDGDYCEIGGLVHGLVCLTINKRISKGRTESVPLICNLSTGQSLPLPKVKTRIVKVRRFFGYDPIEKQYKVLSMTLPFRGSKSQRMCEEHQVLTLGAAGKLSWRMIDCGISHYPVRDIAGICINGGLYYHAVVHHVSSTIVCFDVRSEKFRIINKAKGMVAWRYSALVNYKGKLGAVEVSDNGMFSSITEQTRCLELWVLVDAENHEWLKHVYELPPSWKTVVAEARICFVGMTSREEIVLYYTPGPFCLFYYNLEKKTVTRVELQRMAAVTDYRGHIFLDHIEDVKLMQMFTTL